MKYNKAMELLRKYLQGEANAAETKKVNEWYNAVNEEEAFQSMNEKGLGDVKDQIYRKIKDQVSEISPEIKPVIPLYQRVKWVAAALLVGVICTTTFYLLKQSNNPPESNIAESRLVTVKNDVRPPAGNIAVLKLADGSVVELVNAATGTLAVQGAVQIVKSADGRISYKGNADGAVAYNTLSVPRGSTPVKLALADGTTVWLNVASSITYPVSFTGNERKVEITGEAYFEVAKNTSMPFLVKQSGSGLEVRVLGTYFNVNTYDDEDFMRVTLLEGSVDVSNNRNNLLLTPGQQATVSKTTVKKSTDVNIEEVMAWKNGRFYFEGADIKNIMRQIEKWYDVEVKYEADIRSSFVAKISRDVNVSEILKIFESTDLVHFKIDGKKIIVMQ